MALSSRRRKAARVRLVEAKFETHTSRHGVSPRLRPNFIVGRFDGRPAQRIEWPDAILCEESA